MGTLSNTTYLKSPSMNMLVLKLSKTLYSGNQNYPFCRRVRSFFTALSFAYPSIALSSASVRFLNLPHPLPSGPVGRYSSLLNPSETYKNSFGGLYFLTWSTLSVLPHIYAPLKLSTARTVERWSS
jgi:hypothetical protein